MSGNSEAVRLPREVAYGQPGLELTVVRSGDVVTLYPAKSDFQQMLERLEALPRPGSVQERPPFEAPLRGGAATRE